jgi:homoserine dehydrogenase
MNTSSKKVISVGLLGCGTVGASFFKLTEDSKIQILKTAGAELKIVKVAVKDKNKPRSVYISPELICDDPMEVVNDDSIDVVVECIGGINPALELISAALDNGKSVVSANKELLARYWNHLHDKAAAGKVQLFCEAAVGGAIPVVRALEVSLAGEQISRVTGILNGTTNYILTKMSEEGLAYEDALREAQEMGFAEADPTADVGGHDAASKLAILSSVAFHSEVRADDVFCEGIENVTAADMDFAKRSGYTVKLLAVAQTLGQGAEDSSLGDSGQKIAVRVYPAMVPLTHPLASVRLSFNACFLEGAASGELMLYGRGAGGFPTASAILGDVMTAVSYSSPGTASNSLKRADIYPVGGLENKYCISLYVSDESGVLAKVAEVFAKNKVSIRSMEQMGMFSEARLVFITHMAKEDDMQRTLAELASLACVEKVGSFLRVYGDE